MNSIEWQHLGLLVIGLCFFAIASMRIWKLNKCLVKILDLLEDMMFNKERNGKEEE